MSDWDVMEEENKKSSPDVRRMTLEIVHVGPFALLALIVGLAVLITRLATGHVNELETKYRETEQRYKQMKSPPVVHPKNGNFGQ
jgi:hypothetical protein